MKILIISHMYPSVFNEVNGIFVHQQIKELQKQGCQIKVVSPVPWTPFPIKYFSKKWKRYSEIPKKTNWEGIEVFYPRYLEFPKNIFFASSGERMYLGIRKRVGQIYKDFRFDIIHSHVVLPDGYCGMSIAKEYKKPLIVTVHGQDFQNTIFLNKRCQENIKKVIDFSNGTVAVSNKLKKIGEKKLKINPDKMRVIPNGINADDIFEGESELCKRYKGKKIILSVSHLLKTKGLSLNLRAIDKLKEKYPDIFYLIIGEGEERKNLQKLTKDLNLEKRIDLLGQLPHKKVMEYLSICDIFSLPSWEEGFGIVYLEAMANGKSTIACQEEGIDGIIRDRETGILVKPKDMDSLVEAIDFLLSHPERAKEIGEKAKKLVLENYTWEKAVQKIIEIYKEILKNEKNTKNNLV